MKMFYNHFSIWLLLVIAFPFFCNAQTISWQQTIGGDSGDYLSVIHQLADGGYILGGHSISGISGDKTEPCLGERDFWIIRIDSSGAILWQNTVGGSGFDGLSEIHHTTDGGYICGGQSDSDISGDKSENSNGEMDYWVLKLDSAGSVLWQNTIGGSLNDNLTSVIQTHDGGYLCGGFSASGISGDKSENNLGDIDYWIVKLDANGTIDWQNTIGGQNHDELLVVRQSADGGYYCGGSSDSGISGDKTENCLSPGMGDNWIVKLDSSGAIIWQNTIGGNKWDVLSSICTTPDSGLVVISQSTSDSALDKNENSQGSADFWIYKLDAGGLIQNQNTIGGSQNDIARFINPAGVNGFICGGVSQSGISGDKTMSSQGGIDYWIMQLNANLDIIWQRGLGGSAHDYLFSGELTADSGFICGGWSKSGISGDKTESNVGLDDIWIVKLELDSLTGLSTEEMPGMNVHVFPNPAEQQVNIVLYNLNSPDLLIELMDVTGNIIRSASRKSTWNLSWEGSLDISDLPQGIYFLRINNRFPKNGKIIKY